jgi:GT2 family glycosyltransferase
MTSIIKNRSIADEIIVVDGTPDPEARANSELAHRIGATYIHETKGGVSHARNVGIKAARGEIIVFTDDDFVVQRGWLEKLLSDIDEERVGAATGRMLPLRGDQLSNLYEKSISFDRGDIPRIHSKEKMKILPLLRLFTRFGRKRLLDRTPLPWAVGYGYFAILKSVPQQVGLFDQVLGRGTKSQGGEDIDMFYRILRGGFRISYQPDSVILHSHRHSMRLMLEVARNNGTGNRKFMTRNLLWDSYIFFCLAGTLLWHLSSFMGALMSRDSLLTRLVAEEACGFFGMDIDLPMDSVIYSGEVTAARNSP